MYAIVLVVVNDYFRLLITRTDKQRLLNMNEIVITDTTALDTHTSYDSFVNMALKTVATKSQRIYADTFSKFHSFAVERGLNPADLNPLHVYDFIHAGDYS